MSGQQNHHGKLLHPHHLFTTFKWVIYLLLMWDTWYFLQEDLASSAAMFEGQVTLDNFIQTFSAFIDTLAWVVLLLVFEFETAIIPDEYLQGRLAWLLTGIKALCYAGILYAFYGYVTEFLVFQGVVPFAISDVCSLAGQGWNYVIKLDDYPVLDAASCVSLQGQELFRVPDTELVGSSQGMIQAQHLTIVDVVNAATWLLVVAVLEVEVWMQLKDVLKDKLLQFGKYLKGLLYGILLLCAIYWGLKGDFIDFWDAFLWLVAFIFIELNIFQWHEEIEELHGEEGQTVTK